MFCIGYIFDLVNFNLMLSPDLDPDNYDDWTDESYMQCLGFNFENRAIFSLISTLLQEMEN